MNCHESQKLLDAYIDGEVDPKDRRAVADHVASCPRCAQAVEDRAELASAVRSTRFLPPANLESRILAQISPAPILSCS